MAHFRPALFTFLRDLRADNRREWFLEHEPRYQRDVRDPLLRFIADVGPALRRISPRVVADPRPSGGSMFRIHRDVRFARDKSPYKTHAAAQFRHAAGRDVHAPGYYLHLEPGEVFFGAGIWRPDGRALGAIRDALVARPAAWRRLTGDRRFRAACALSGESLRRVPRGYDPDHPLAEDLRRKDFVAVQELADRDACRDDFLDRFVGFCRATAPLMAFLTGALELDW